MKFVIEMGSSGRERGIFEDFVEILNEKNLKLSKTG